MALAGSTSRSHSQRTCLEDYTQVRCRVSSFEGWLHSVTFNPDAPVDDPGEVTDANLRWLRRFFDAQGPVSTDVVNAAFLADQVTLANEAVAAVLNDLDRTSSFRPQVVVDDYEGNGVRIWIDHGYIAPSMWAVDRPEAIAEVAEYFQDQLDQTVGCWPQCAEHDARLDAQVHDEAAVWWCRVGGHAVALIGELGS